MSPGISAVGLSIAAIGGGVLYYARRMHRRQQDALINSTNVWGTVTTVDIDSRTRDGNTTYYPVLEYEYLYLEDTYTGDNLYPGTGVGRFGYSTKSRAESLVDEYEAGDELSVFVSTTDPSRSFVIRETTPRNVYLIAAIGLSFVLLGLYMLI